MVLIPPHRSATLIGVLLAALLTAAASPFLASAQSPAASPVASAAVADLYAAILPEHRADVVAETDNRLSRYRIDARLHPAAGSPATISGHEELHFVNDTGETLDDLYFRLYANTDIYAEGGIELRDVRVDGTPVAPELSVGETVARIPLPSPLPPGAAVDVSLAFTTTVPTAPARSYGMFSFQPATGTLALAHWYPVLAGFDPTTGWVLDPPSVNGDLVFSNTALYDVTLAAPSDLVLVTSGTEVSETVAGETIARRYVTGPVRDFTVVADDDYAAVRQDVDGTTVTSYYEPGDEAGGEAVLRSAVQSLDLFNELFGPYPYTEVDLVQVDLGNGAAGVEFPQLVFIGGDYYDDGAAGLPLTFLETIVAHEVAHQWWYGLVGNNQYVDAFIDEGLTNYASAAIYPEMEYGADVGAAQAAAQLAYPYLRALFEAGIDPIVDQPTDAFDQGTYGVAAYGKAALGFGAIREAIGDEAFFDALRDYTARMRFDVATPDDLLAAFERASGQDLSDLWRRWFEAAEGREAYSVEDWERLQDLGA